MSSAKMRETINILMEARGGKPKYSDSASSTIKSVALPSKPRLSLPFGNSYISPDTLARYAETGSPYIPAESLALGIKLAFSSDADIVHSDPEWKAFAVSVYDKALEQVTNANHEPLRPHGKPNPESWTSINRAKILLAKRILVRANARSAKYF